MTFAARNAGETTGRPGRPGQRTGQQQIATSRLPGLASEQDAWFAAKLVGLSNAADDAAAATAGVAVGGMYRNGSILMVRVA